MQFYIVVWWFCVFVKIMIVSSAQFHRTYMNKTNWFWIFQNHWKENRHALENLFFVLFCHIYQSHILTPVMSFDLQRSPAAPLDCSSCRVSNHSTDVRGHGALKGPFSGELSDSSATDSAGIQYHSGGLSRQRDRDITPSEYRNNTQISGTMD